MAPHQHAGDVVAPKPRVPQRAVKARGVQPVEGGRCPTADVAVPDVQPEPIHQPRTALPFQHCCCRRCRRRRREHPFGIAAADDSHRAGTLGQRDCNTAPDAVGDQSCGFQHPITAHGVCVAVHQERCCLQHSVLHGDGQVDFRVRLAWAFVFVCEFVGVEGRWGRGGLMVLARKGNI